MKKTVLTVLILLLMLTGCGGNNPDADGESGLPAGSEEVTITSTSTGVVITIAPPAGWNLSEHDIALAYFTHSSVSPAYLIISENLLPDSAQEPDLYVEFEKEKYSNKYDNVEFNEPERLTIDGNDARKITFTGDVLNRSMKYMMVYIFRDGYAYKASGSAPALRFGSLESDFEQLINSLKLE